MTWKICAKITQICLNLRNFSASKGTGHRQPATKVKSYLNVRCRYHARQINQARLMWKVLLLLLLGRYKIQSLYHKTQFKNTMESRTDGQNTRLSPDIWRFLRPYFCHLEALVSATVLKTLSRVMIATINNLQHLSLGASLLIYGLLSSKS